MFAKPSSPSSLGYLPHIDGLRGLAVLVILMFHLDVAVFKGGFVGVDIFFVISGYLITSIIAREMAAGTFSFANFYARRIRRIFPALFVMLLGSSAAAIFFLGLDQYSAFFEAMRKASAQISNFYFARETDYFAEGNAHSALLHTWSLGVEEQFYLVWPLLLLFTRKFIGAAKAGWVLGLVAIISLGLSEYLVRTDAMQAFYMLHARAWELAIGGIVALRVLPQVSNARAAQVIGMTGMGLILFAVFFIDSANFPGLEALIPCMGVAMFIYAAQTQAGIVHRLLSVRPIVWTGLISYSLYLWHWPVIAFYKSYFGTQLDAPVQAGMFALSFLLAIASYKFIEQPFRRIEAKPWKVITAGLLTIVVFIIFGNLIKKHSDADWRVTYDVTEHVRDPHELDKICSVEGGAYDKDNCIIGPNKDSYEVILVGDSHASHYTPTVLAWAAEKGLTVRIFLRGACRTWVQTDEVRIKSGKVDTYCMDLVKAFYQTLENDKSIRYVFLGLYMPQIEETKASLERIASFGKNVYYLGQVPVFEHNAHECQIRKSLLASHLFPRDDGRDCMALDHDYSKETLAEKIDPFKAALGPIGIHYFDPVPYIDRPFDAEGRFMYLDSNHLNRYGARHLAKPLADFIEKTK